MTLAQQAMVRSQAEQIRAYIKAIRKGGGLLREMAEAGERQSSGGDRKSSSRGATMMPSLTDMGFTKSRASPSVAGNVVRFPANVLIESGMSQRTTAKLLGVDHKTIRRDLGHKCLKKWGNRPHRQRRHQGAAGGDQRVVT